MILRLTTLLACTTLMAGLAYAQAPSDPPSRGIVSPPATSIQLEPEPAKTTADTSTAADPAAGNIQPGSIKPESADDAAIDVDPASLLPSLPPLPHANATLVGGTLAHLDRIRDQVTVQVFGGGQVKALFDPRTRVFRGSKEVTIADLHQGERIYLDTILDGSTVFARTIRLQPSAAVGESQGIVLRYRADRGELAIRDGLSPSPVRVRLTSATQFMQSGHPVSSSSLLPGSLVNVSFASQGNGHDVARQITILAMPGANYVFSGQIVHIDLRNGLLVLNSSTDHKTYEVYMDPSTTPDDNLHAGTKVTVVTNFENSRYVVRNLKIDSNAR